MSTLAALPGWLLDKVRYAYKRYPARTQSLVVAALVFAAAKLGIVVKEQDLLQAAAYALPILLGGQVVHSKVEPVKKVKKPLKLRSPKRIGS